MSLQPHWSKAFGNTMRWLWVLASMFSPSTDNKVCWLLRFIVFVLNLGGLLTLILAQYRHTLPLSIWRHCALFMSPGIRVLIFWFLFCP